MLIDGPLAAVSTIGDTDLSTASMGMRRQSPQWWWPDDRAWFVGTEIDFAWTYVVGPEVLIDAIVEHGGVEAVRIDHGDPW